MTRTRPFVPWPASSMLWLPSKLMSVDARLLVSIFFSLCVGLLPHSGQTTARVAATTATAADELGGSASDNR